MFLIFFMLICQRWYFVSKKFVYLMFYVSLKYTFVISVILFFFVWLKFFCDYLGIDLNFCMNHIIIYLVELCIEIFKSKSNNSIVISFPNPTNYITPLSTLSKNNLPATIFLHFYDPWQSTILFCQQKHQTLVDDFFVSFSVLKKKN